MTRTAASTEPAVLPDAGWAQNARFLGWPYWQINHLARLAGAYVEASESSVRIRHWDGRVEVILRDSRTLGGKAPASSANWPALEERARFADGEHEKALAAGVPGAVPTGRPGDAAPPCRFGVCGRCGAPRLVNYADGVCNNCGRWMTLGALAAPAPISVAPTESAVVDRPDEPDAALSEATEDDSAEVAAEPEDPWEQPDGEWVKEAIAHRYPRPLIDAIASIHGDKTVTETMVLVCLPSGASVVIPPSASADEVAAHRDEETDASAGEDEADEDPAAAPIAADVTRAPWQQQMIDLGWPASTVDSILRPGLTVHAVSFPTHLMLTVGSLTMRVGRIAASSSPVTDASLDALREWLGSAPAAADTAPADTALADAVAPAADVAPAAADSDAAPAALDVPADAGLVTRWADRALELGWPPLQIETIGKYWPATHPMQVFADHIICPAGSPHQKVRHVTFRPNHRIGEILARNSAAYAAIGGKPPSPNPLLDICALGREAALRAPSERPLRECVPCRLDGLERYAFVRHPVTHEGVCEDWETIHPDGQAHTVFLASQAETGDVSHTSAPPIDAERPAPYSGDEGEEPAAESAASVSEMNDDEVPWDTTVEDSIAHATPTDEAPAPPQPATTRPRRKRNEWLPPLDLTDPVTGEPWTGLEGWTDAAAGSHMPAIPAGIGVVYVSGGVEYKRASVAIGNVVTYRAELRAIEYAIKYCPDDEPLYVVGDNQSALKVSEGLAVPNACEDVVARIRAMVAERKRRGVATYFRHVNGHVGHLWNHLADYLAWLAVKEHRKTTCSDPTVAPPPKADPPPKPTRPARVSEPKSVAPSAPSAEEAARAAEEAARAAEEIARKTDARVLPSLLPPTARKQLSFL